METRAQRADKRLAWIVDFFSGWKFAAFALSAILVYEVLILALFLVPPGGDPVGRFAEEFKTWCFGYDPATGASQPMYVILMITEPLALGLVLAGVYWKQLRAAARRPARFLPYLAMGVVAVLGSLFLFFQPGTAAAQEGELPFPAERIRTQHRPPAFDLLDQDGERLHLEALQGQVVVVTGIYASCGFTCPLILQQVKRALEGLEEAERAEISVVAITLDPERDSSEVLARLAEAQGVAAPRYRFGTGEPAAVEALLDRLGIERRRDPETGIIDHTNLFLVIDRGGRIAYRFTLGERQERWLQTALRLLVREEPLG